MIKAAISDVRSTLSLIAVIPIIHANHDRINPDAPVSTIIKILRKTMTAMLNLT